MNPFSVKKINGIPQLFKDGEFFPPILYWAKEVDEIDFPVIRKMGISLFDCFASWDYDVRPYWIGKGKYDFSFYDEQLTRFVELVPDGYIIPRIYVTAPYWWLDENPDEVIRYANDVPYTRGITASYHESFASEKWKAEQGEAFRLLMRHFKQAPYGDRIAGIHVAGGPRGEWHQWHDGSIPDSSPAMAKRFGRPVPAPAARNHEYYECYFSAAVDAIEHFCRIVKEETDYLTAVFYGYLSERHHTAGAHFAAEKFLKLDCVDIVSAPHSYKRRFSGGDGYFRTFTASLIANGKLFLDESDDRTTLGKLEFFGTDRIKAETPELAVGMLRREYGLAATHCVGQWIMDVDHGMFRDPLYLKTISELVQYCRHISAAEPQRVSEVAVISDPGGNYYYSRWQFPAAVNFELMTIPALMKSGAPFDFYCACDLDYERMKKYKVIILGDCMALAPEARAVLKQLQCEKRTFISFCGAGAIDREYKMSYVDAMRDLTGVEFKQIPSMLMPQKTWDYPGWKMDSPRRYDEWDMVPQSPGFTPESADIDFGSWRSVYRAIADFSPEELRTIFRENGVHIYCSGNDVCSVSSNLLMLHASADGEKQITLPQSFTVTDLISGKVVGENITTFTTVLKLGETALFELQTTK
ncbi:MAG: hypothetical protein J6C40_06895 [Lentisphaeria bacterium]|nr:hypothetical protein [Lentisphaeria bacterium]